jgi:hypothetical protein
VKSNRKERNEQDNQNVIIVIAVPVQILHSGRKSGTPATVLIILTENTPVMSINFLSSGDVTKFSFPMKTQTIKLM